MALFTVPAGKKGYILGFYGSSAGASKTTKYILRLKGREQGGVWQLKHKVGVDDAVPYDKDYAIYNGPFPEKSDIEITAEITATGVTGANFIAGFDIILVDD